jgi:hypothetical protein
LNVHVHVRAARFAVPVRPIRGTAALRLNVEMVADGVQFGDGCPVDDVDSVTAEVATSRPRK